MSLDGLRAWIGEVERKLGKRTRVFLVLAAIAVGGAGAAIYLAIDAQENSVSKADVQTVRDELEERIGAAAGEADQGGLEAKLSALQAEVTRLKDEAAASAKVNGAAGGSTEKAGGEGTGGSGPSGGGHPESTPKAKEQAGK